VGPAWRVLRARAELRICRDRATAKWAAGPFDCGTRGWTVDTDVSDAVDHAEELFTAEAEGQE